MPQSLIQRIKYSPLGRVATLPLRLRSAFVPLLRQAGASLRWLWQSREWTNYSYDYTTDGLSAVVNAVALITERSATDVRAMADELAHDEVFARRYRERVGGTRLRYICDPELRLGRCLVNYLLVRASGARTVFEAGTDRGLSSWAIVRALQRNGAPDSLLITIDLAADRGELLEGDEGGLVQRHVGDSVACLKQVTRPIDLFLHDTVNEPAHTTEQLTALAPRLAPRGIVHSCWFSESFVTFCETHGLRTLELAERPARHWYPGRRTGLARQP